MTPRTVALSLLAAACVASEPPPSDATPTPGVVINELMADNVSSWPDADAPGCPEFDDWIELYNASADPVDLTGWGLSDDPAVPARFVLPATTLEPGGWLVVTADSEPEQGPLHAPFSLGAGGEDVVLTDAAGVVVDQLRFPALLPDQAWGRRGDGSTSLGLLSRATPGEANPAQASGPCLVPPVGFDDHTFPCLSSLDDYQQLAADGVGMREVKFEIPGFANAATRRPCHNSNIAATFPIPPNNFAKPAPRVNFR
jgi:hypothetical protein